MRSFELKNILWRYQSVPTDLISADIRCQSCAHHWHAIHGRDFTEAGGKTALRVTCPHCKTGGLIEYPPPGAPNG